MVPDGASSGDGRDEDREVHERLALPLLIPAVVFLFAVLVIYGLSRIYLELHQWDYRGVSMATPAAIGVALVILLTATYLASQRSISRAQIGFVVLVGATLLTTGAIWAAAREDKGEEGRVIGPTATLAPDQTPALPGTVAVTLIDPEFAVIVDPATNPTGSITFNVTNAGSILHNLRVISTDLDQADLPIDGETFSVDESLVDVVASLQEFDAGQTEELTADLAAGPYVLICNVPTHYESGMHTPFTVE